MRGERELTARRCRTLRFIPACAGNAVSGSRRSPAHDPVHPRVRGERSRRAAEALAQSTVHPRVRGERAAQRPPLCDRVGSSPRARGTAQRGRSPRDASVHPRVRGERDRRSPDDLAESVHPRVRGERASASGRRASKQRFIPACAGNRIRRRRAASQWRFIPACAGNATSSHADRSVVGSSPRARGTRERSEKLREPAVHPRVRGERRDRLTILGSGSSPRARGTRGRRLGGEPRFIPACAGNACHAATGAMRFIPACAGNAAGAGLNPGRPVHPRVRGEHGRRVPGTLDGSSPRARGTPARDYQPRIGSSPRARGTPAKAIARWSVRFIPACAGNYAADARSEGVPSFGLETPGGGAARAHRRPRARRHRWPL